MRTKEQIIEDLEILEASMMHSDDPEYAKVHDSLLEELLASINDDMRVRFLDEVCILEGHIRNWIDPDYEISFGKIRETVHELRAMSLPF